jgi:hydrogenase expression/formation protein HypC
LTASLARYKKDAMCLAIPGKVEEIITEGDLRMGRVNFGGVVKRVCLDYVPELVVGDYTIVHVGFALSKIDEESAEKTLAVFREMGMLEEELASEEEAFARAANAPQSACPDGSCLPKDEGLSARAPTRSCENK